MEQAQWFTSAPRGRSEIVAVSVDTRVTKAAQVMNQNRVGCLVVVDEAGKLAGIVSERDILRWVSGASPATYTAVVRDIMTAGVVTCTRDTSPGEAHRIMVQHGIRHLPVVEGGRPVGMLSARDLMSRQAGI